MEIVWTRPALADLAAIQAHVAERSAAAAWALTTAVVDRTTTLLADNPLIGRQGRVAGTRELVVSGTPYIVAYRVRSRVEVLAVMHGAREWPDPEALTSP